MPLSLALGPGQRRTRPRFADAPVSFAQVAADLVELNHVSDRRAVAIHATRHSARRAAAARALSFRWQRSAGRARRTAGSMRTIALAAACARSVRADLDRRDRDRRYQVGLGLGGPRSARPPSSPRPGSVFVGRGPQASRCTVTGPGCHPAPTSARRQQFSGSYMEVTHAEYGNRGAEWKPSVKPVARRWLQGAAVLSKERFPSATD